MIINLIILYIGTKILNDSSNYSIKYLLIRAGLMRQLVLDIIAVFIKRNMEQYYVSVASISGDKYIFFSDRHPREIQSLFFLLQDTFLCFSVWKTNSVYAHFKFITNTDGMYLLIFVRIVIFLC